MNNASLIGIRAPQFKLPCVDSDGQIRETSLAEYQGKWLALIFYPQDFSMICPTELTEFSARLPEFRQRNCELLGVNSDSIQRHEEWLETPVSEGGLGPIRFPLASDDLGSLARQFGAWHHDQQVSLRGLFIVDPDGVVQYSVIHNLSVGRTVDEIIRVIDALRSGGLCPVNWTRADGTIDVEDVLQPGRLIGHYRVQETLGKGNFGTVVAAHDEQLDRDVAVKVLRKNVIQSRADLLGEARAAAKLQHPNICAVFAIEDEVGVPLISMERIDGECLCHLIEKGLIENQQIRIAHGIAEGLAAAHAQSVTHGDLKPANVLVLKDGTPKILDFGLARGNRANQDKLDSASDHPLDKAKVSPKRLAETLPEETPSFDALADTSPEIAGQTGISGTPRYMSPEQVQGETTTPASDVFSFGLVWYELLTGRKALPDSLAGILQSLRSPKLADQLSADVPTEFQEPIRSLLATQAHERPSINSVVQLLR